MQIDIDRGQLSYVFIANSDGYLTLAVTVEDQVAYSSIGVGMLLTLPTFTSLPPIQWTAESDLIPSMRALKAAARSIIVMSI